MVMMVDGMRWGVGGLLIVVTALELSMGFLTEALRRSTQASSCVTVRPSWNKQHHHQETNHQSNQTHQNDTNMKHWKRHYKIKLNNPATKIKDVSMLYTNSKTVFQNWQKMIYFAAVLYCMQCKWWMLMLWLSPMTSKWCDTGVREKWSKGTIPRCLSVCP